MFGQNIRKLIIVCDDQTHGYGNYLRQLVSTNDDDNNIVGTKDGSIGVAVWLEKDYLANMATITSDQHVLFIGENLFLKNPIVDSGIIGISSGASLGAVIAVSLGLTATNIFVMPIFSGAFALIISAIIYKISTLRGRTDNLLLILSGIAIGSFVGAITSAILTSLEETEMKEYIFWAMGSLNGRRWEHFFFGLIPIAILSPILFYYGKELNILLLGEEEAKSLGINIKKIRGKILIIIALLTAISVCISGNITFVGLIVPHILRKLIGSDNRKLLKSSFLAGACFLTFSDLVSRIVLAPKEISVGIVTALIGAPYFIYLIVKIRREGKTL